MTIQLSLWRGEQGEGAHEGFNGTEPAQPQHYEFVWPFSTSQSNLSSTFQLSPGKSPTEASLPFIKMELVWPKK